MDDNATAETSRPTKSALGRDGLIWAALVVAGLALLIAGVGALLALVAGHARFIEVAWVSIAASLFVLACDHVRPRRE